MGVWILTCRKNIFRMPFSNCLIELPDIGEISPSERGKTAFFHVRQEIGSGLAWTEDNTYEVVRRGENDVQLWVEYFALKRHQETLRYQLRRYPGAILLDMSSTNVSKFDFAFCRLEFEGAREQVEESVNFYRNLMFGFVSLINSKSAQLTSRPASDKLNRKRIAQKREPLYSYQIVDLPAREQKRSTGEIGDRMSPRLHWRRGHMRRWKGGLIPVSPCVVGTAELGVVAHLYRVGASRPPHDPSAA